MKRILLSLIIGFNFFLSSYAQIYTTGPNVYTCKNGVVATIVPNRELNSTELADIDYALFNSNGIYYYLGIQSSDIISAPTSYYNCHAYAWHLREGNSNQVWINRGTNDSNLSKYWDSNVGCFVQVASESSAEKIYYYTGDHSAVKSTVTGKYESKWGSWYAIRHSPNQVPYTSPDDRRYYVSTDITGDSSPLCNNSTRNFSTINIPNASYDWEVGPGITLNDDGEHSTSVTTGSSYAGETWIEVEITSPLGGSSEDVKISKRFTFWVGAPALIGISGPTYGPIGQQQTYSVQLQSNLSSPTDYVWMITPSGGATITDWGNYCWVTFNSPGTYQLLVHAINNCNWSAPAMLYINASGGMFMSISPNPTSGEATLSIESNSEETTFDENAEWGMEVYSPTHSLKTKRYKLKGKSTKIQTHGWKEGVYVVRVKYKDEILTGKLVVKK